MGSETDPAFQNHATYINEFLNRTRVAHRPDYPIVEYPVVTYDWEIDQIEVLLEGANHYGQWSNHHLTLLRAQDDGRVVGFEIFGILRSLIRSPRVGEPTIERKEDK